MLKDVLKAVLRVLAGTIFLLALAATIGIPAGKRGPAAAQPGDEPRGLDLGEAKLRERPLAEARVVSADVHAALWPQRQVRTRAITGTRSRHRR
jgi:hypothetical protein